MALSTGRRTLLRPLIRAPRRGQTPTVFFSQQRRMYHEIRVGMLGRYPKTIRSKVDATKAVDDLFELLHKADALGERPGCLSVFTFPEFGFNHSIATIKGDLYDMADTNEDQWNASNPLTMEEFQAIVERVRWQSRLLPTGYLFAFGGLAVDTGREAIGGLIRALNLGFLIESGPTADCVLYSKYHHDPVDKWDLSKFLVDVADEHIGPLTRTIKDPSGGRAVVITAMICADMEKGPFPTEMWRSDLVVCSSYGTPKWWQLKWLEEGVVSEYATVAVNENSSGDLNPTGPVGMTQLVRKPKHPWLVNLHSAAQWGGLGDFALGAYQTLLGVSPTEALATTLGFEKITTTVRHDNGLKLISTEPRKLFGDLPRAEEVDGSSDQ